MNRERLGLMIAVLAVVFMAVSVAYAQQQQERICFSCADHSEFIWGGDLLFYSDEASTQKLHIDGLTGNIDSEGTLDVAGSTTMNSLGITGAADFDSTVNVDGAAALNSTLDVDGNISSGTGAITFTDNVMIDGAADLVQLTVQGYTTQTNNIFVVENYTQTDAFAVDASGYVTVTSELTVPDIEVTDDITITDDLVVGGGDILVDSYAFTYTAPITISGVLTNVRLLYYQVP